jgi:hypothetical protein
MPGISLLRPEIRRNRHVQLRGVQIGQIVKAEYRVVAVYTLDLVPVPGPQCPKGKLGPVGRRKQGESVDTAVLPDPVPDLHMIGMGVLCESSGLGLLRGEEALLLLGELEAAPRRFTMRLRPRRSGGGTGGPRRSDPAQTDYALAFNNRSIARNDQGDVEGVRFDSSEAKRLGYKA